MLRSPAGKVTPELLLEKTNSKSEMVTGYNFPVVKQVETNNFATYSSLTAFVDGTMVEVKASDSEKQERNAEVKKVLENVLGRLKTP